jgi:ABC-type bacteriocin/lantibiotic exporters, contain an N-terminal double-glycine peptidase domain
VSGVGKSTFLHIIYGIFENYNGSIKIDGSNIKNDVEGYSNLFGYISQHNFVFNDSILENITFKKKLNTKEINKLKKIYEICGLDNVLESFNQIFKKKITMDDTSISGGQKQRIIIARTLYKEPKILLLDEATSGLDLHSEYEILNNIIKSFKDITIISVSHRPIRKLFNKIYKIK